MNIHSFGSRRSFRPAAVTSQPASRRGVAAGGPMRPHLEPARFSNSTPQTKFPFDNPILNSLREAQPLDSLARRGHSIPYFPRWVNQTGWLIAFKRALCTTLIWIWKWRYQSFKVEGKERLKALREVDRPIIIVANHRSKLDPPMIGAIVSAYLQPTWFMAKAELWKTVFDRVVWALSATIPIAREGRTAQLEPFMSVLKAKRRRQVLVMFVEGTRPGAIEAGKAEGLNLLASDVEPETGMLPGHASFLYLALASQALVVPMGISGAARAAPPGKRYGIATPRKPRECVIRVQVGEPLDLFKELQEGAERDTETGQIKFKSELRNAGVARTMGAISRLVDLSLETFPPQLPVTPADYERQRAVEAGQAALLRAKGLDELAAVIDQRHAEQRTRGAAPGEA